MSWKGRRRGVSYILGYDDPLRSSTPLIVYDLYICLLHISLRVGTILI